MKAGSLNGDGSVTAPFGSIAEALAQATAGDVLVIGEGRYEESIEPSVDITLWGACVERVILDAPGPHGGGSVGAVKVTAGRRISLRNLTISGAQIGLLVDGMNAHAEVNGVRLQNNTRYGAAVINEGEAILEGALITDTAPVPNGDLGWGAVSAFGGILTVRSSSFEHNRQSGLIAFGWEGEQQTVLNVQNTLIRDTLANQIDGEYGEGLAAWDGAEVMAARVLLQGNRTAGIIGAANNGFPIAANLTMTDIIVRDTLESTNGNGEGMVLYNGASSRLIRAVFVNNHSKGISLYHETGMPGSSLDVEDLAIIDSQPGPGLAGDDDSALWVENHSTAALSRAFIARNAGGGITVLGDAGVDVTNITLEDVAILNSQLDGGGESGYGLFLRDGIGAITRTLFSGNKRSEIILTSQSELDLRHATLRDGHGSGIDVRDSSRLTIDQTLVERTQECGICIQTEFGEDRPVLSLNMLAVRNTNGRGINALNGVEMTLDRVLLENNQVHGVTSLSPEQASAATALSFNREHWGIENKVHWVRDVTFDEDRSQVRRGEAPQTMATLRNLVVGLLRLCGVENIAAGLRHLSWNQEKVLALVGV